MTALLSYHLINRKDEVRSIRKSKLPQLLAFKSLSHTKTNCRNIPENFDSLGFLLLTALLTLLHRTFLHPRCVPIYKPRLTSSDHIFEFPFMDIFWDCIAWHHHFFLFSLELLAPLLNDIILVLLLCNCFPLVSVEVELWTVCHFTFCLLFFLVWSFACKCFLSAWYLFKIMRS